MIANLLQPTHLILILVILLIVIGPGKLPDIGKAFGEAIKGFKQTKDGDSELSSAENGKES
ncbi:MAG: twin-arginine translocase TatA/TatE family subunit [Syntrophomonas sp.]